MWIEEPFDDKTSDSHRTDWFCHVQQSSCIDLFPYWSTDLRIPDHRWVTAQLIQHNRDHDADKGKREWFNILEDFYLFIFIYMCRRSHA